MFDRIPLAVVVLTACSAAGEPKDSSVHDTGEVDTDTASDTSGETADTDTDTTTFTGTARVVDMGTEADAKFIGEPTNVRSNELVIGQGGDVNNDGRADVLLSTASYGGSAVQSGRAYVFFGPVTGRLDVTTADVIVEGEPEFLLGASIGTAGDMNHDAINDLAIGQRSYDDGDRSVGRVIVAFGPLSHGGSVDGLDSTSLLGEDDGTGCGGSVGTSLGAAGDVNDDGFDDLVIGFEFLNACDGLGGGYVVYGPLSPGTFKLADVAAMRITNATIGGDISGAGDTNGDGFDDVMLGVSFDDPAALLYYGPTAGDVSRTDADLTFWAPDGEFAGGAATAGGDINGDGYADLLIDEVTDSEGGGEYAGAAYVVYGPTGSGRLELGTVETKLLGIREETLAGYDLDGPGDVNGDGFSDILVGAPDYWGEDTSMAFLVLGPTYGTRSLNDADLVFLPDGGEDHAGASLAAAGDVDGDGLPDLLIGGPGDEDGGTYAGAAWLFYAGNLW